MLKFVLFLNDIMNVILGLMEKMQQYALRNILTIQFYNRDFYSRTKMSDLHSDCETVTFS